MAGEVCYNIVYLGRRVILTDNGRSWERMTRGGGGLFVPFVQYLHMFILMSKKKLIIFVSGEIITMYNHSEPLQCL